MVQAGRSLPSGLQEADKRAKAYVATSRHTAAGDLQKAISSNPKLDVTEPETQPTRFLSAARSAGKIQSAESLHLYELLSHVSAFLKESIDELVQDGANAEKLRPILSASVLCTQSLESLKRIMHLFSETTLEDSYQFERYFVNLCDALKEHGTDVKPRHLRDFAQRFKKFETLVFRYFYKQKEFMSAQEKELFNEINLFCYRLRFCLLNEDYFDFSLTSLFADQFFFKPIEWISNHKLLSVTILIAVALVYYFYLHPKFFPPNPLIAVVNGCFKQASAPECAMYAIANAVAMQQPDPQAVFNKNPAFNMAALLQAARNDLAANPDALNRLPTTTNWLNGDEAIALLENSVFMQQLCEQMGVVFNPQNPSMGVRVIQGGELSQSDVTYPQILEVDRGLRAGNPQATICFQGNTNESCRGHWVAARFIPPTAEGQAVRVEVADSLSHGFFKDITWCPHLHSASAMFTKGVVSLSNIDLIRQLRGTDQYFTPTYRPSGPDGLPAVDPSQRKAELAFNSYAQTLRQMSAAGALANQDQLPYQEAERIFTMLRQLATTDADRNQANPIILPPVGDGGPAVQIDLREVQTFADVRRVLGV
jgi:hypothetical protein